MYVVGGGDITVPHAYTFFRELVISYYHNNNLHLFLDQREYIKTLKV